VDGTVYPTVEFKCGRHCSSYCWIQVWTALFVLLLNSSVDGTVRFPLDTRAPWHCTCLPQFHPVYVIGISVHCMWSVFQCTVCDRYFSALYVIGISVHSMWSVFQCTVCDRYFSALYVIGIAVRCTAVQLLECTKKTPIIIFIIILFKRVLPAMSRVWTLCKQMSYLQTSNIYSCVEGSLCSLLLACRPADLCLTLLIYNCDVITARTLYPDQLH
jgi:hypothetical protein